MLKPKVKEIKTKNLDTKRFIEEQIRNIKNLAGDKPAILALSGGVDSSVVAVLGHRALGNQLRIVFIDNGLMRENEPRQVVKTFEKLGIPVEVIDAKKEFFSALEGLDMPEDKREAITQTFYRDVFGRIVRESGASSLLQGTIYTDIEETVAGIKRQHNVFEQIGIDPVTEFGYVIIEPIVRLRKDGVRKLAKALKLPKSVYGRIPFPGPALAARIIGEVGPQNIKLIRKATAITEKILRSTKAFQYMAILHKDMATGIVRGERKFGLQIEIRCWNSIDARKAKPTKVPWNTLFRLARKITEEIPDVVSVTYNITEKGPSTMEAI
ncbi:MAG: ATP-binding protein [Minisyncoccia bacterium]